MVLPKPSLRVLTTFSAGSVAKARNTETRKSAMNAFTLSVEVRTTIANMLIITKIEVRTVDIDGDYVKKRYATKIAVVKPARSARRPHPIACLVFLIPTEPKYTATI